MADADLTYETLPTHCPNCDNELEIGEPRTVTDQQQSTWAFFKNGAYTIANPKHPLPRRCNVCSVLWLNEPRTGKCMALRGV